MRLSGPASQRPARPPERGGALVTFLATALVLVTALAVLLRFRPELFGVARPPREDGARAVGFPPRPAEPADAARDAPRPVAAAREVAPGDEVAADVFREASASVCLVVNLDLDPAAIGRATAETSVQGTGSGLVWDTLGHVVTSAHVVDRAQAATVVLADGSEHEAWLVGVDRSADVAVMRIDRPPAELVPVRVGRSSELVVGQRVFAIGMPLGLGHTLSAGIVSGLGRDMRTSSGLVLEDMIQTDADLHQGSSGGPLLDTSARLVGLAVASHTEARSGGGLAFALPVDVLQEVVPRLVREGFEWFPRLGFVAASDSQSVQLLDALRAVGEASGAPWRSAIPGQGVVVAVVDEPSPAAEAGVRGMLQGRRVDGRDEYTVRDIVVAVDGARVADRAALDRALRDVTPGRAVALTLAGANGERDVRLVAK